MAEDKYKQMQDARRALRHAAHVYSKTKKTPENMPNHEDAVEKLENAAFAFVLAAGIHGVSQPVAPPAASKRAEWEHETDPEPR